MGGLVGRIAVIFFSAVVLHIFEVLISQRRYHAMHIGSGFIDAVFLVDIVVEVGGESAEDLVYFFVLFFIGEDVAGGLDFGVVVTWKDHVVYEFSNALAVNVVKDLTDHALQEGLVMELQLLFLLVLSSLFTLVLAVYAGVLAKFLLRFAANKTINIS